MSYQELELNIEKMPHTVVNQVNENSRVLRQELIDNGYTVGELENILAGHDTQIVDILDVISGTDDNISTINAVAGIGSIYYAPWEVGSSFTVDDYNRWALTQADLYDIVANGKGRWGYLILSDGQPTIDGKTIIMRGEPVGS